MRLAVAFVLAAACACRAPDGRDDGTPSGVVATTAEARTTSGAARSDARGPSEVAPASTTVVARGSPPAASASGSTASRDETTARAPRLAPEHDVAFYRALVAAPLALPDGVDATSLVRDLQRWLGDPDPARRDTFAYGLPAVWIRRGLVDEDALLELVESWRANLRAGVGETGGEGVLRRSFSVLALDSVLARDARRPFLAPRVAAGLAADLVRYLERERDLRAFDARLGWIHATAHTADALRRVVAHEAVDDALRARVVDAIESKLSEVGRVFTHGENRRLAAVLAVLVVRDGGDVEPILAWRARARERERALWAVPDLDEGLFARVENETQVFESLLAALTTLPEDSANARRVRAAVAAD